MQTRQSSAAALARTMLDAMPNRSVAQVGASLVLPPARIDFGLTLMQTLRLRRSTRAYSDRPVPDQVLSDLLWSASGINRQSGERTAPCWRHLMLIDVYVVRADGVWRYDPEAHALVPHLREDLRALTGLQDFVASAPLELVYVAHGECMADISAEDRRLYASADAAFIGQNVYLFCASEGLATVFRGAVDQVRLGRALELPDHQFVTFAQSVGYGAA